MRSSPLHDSSKSMRIDPQNNEHSDMDMNNDVNDEAPEDHDHD